MWEKNVEDRYSDSDSSNDEGEPSDHEAYESVIHGDGDELAAPYLKMSRRKKKALLELRIRVEDAISGNYLLEKPDPYRSEVETSEQRKILSEISLWGVPLLPSRGHEGTDIVLLKFLRAKDFHVHNSFQMLRRTLKWRKAYKADEIVDEKLGLDLVDMKSRDKKGHPLCYSGYGGFENGEGLDSEEKCEKLLRWRVQYIEKVMKKLEFKNGGVDSVVHITDLKSSPGPATKELRSVSKKVLLLLQENYPELVHKHIVVNAPLWYYAIHMLRSRLLTQRTKRKFVFARPTKVTKTLLKFITPENLLVQYGGLKRENDDEFSELDEASELIIKGNSTVFIEFSALAGFTMVWDLTVVGWEVSYKEEFVPDDECSYRILIQNQKRMGESVRNSFYISEPGKITITIDNSSFKKKRILYRSKAKPTTVPMYIVKNQL